MSQNGIFSNIPDQSTVDTIPQGYWDGRVNAVSTALATQTPAPIGGLGGCGCDNNKIEKVGTAGFGAYHLPVPGYGSPDGLGYTPGGAPPTTGEYVYTGLAVASSAACAYHGYKRNNGSVGWAIGWWLLGGLLPVVAPVIAVAQGFAKPKGR